MYQYQFLLTNADIDTLASKISYTNADTYTLEFTDHFYFEFVATYCMYTYHHSINIQLKNSN